MRCKGVKVMWQGERMWRQRGVIGQGVNDDNSGGDMERKWNMCQEVRGREIMVEKE
jgi:hypothetical protein